MAQEFSSTNPPPLFSQLLSSPLLKTTIKAPPHPPSLHPFVFASPCLSILFSFGDFHLPLLHSKGKAQLYRMLFPWHPLFTASTHLTRSITQLTVPTPTLPAITHTHTHTHTLQTHMCKDHVCGKERLKESKVRMKEREMEKEGR